ncbi:MAG: class 1 fructose-bisphosphatase [Candidatus Latescibacterota bacterium]|nr:MAG: class 1 fructose-bisphosphatase [Candidatus Latescibacterota bacterium]
MTRRLTLTEYIIEQQRMHPGATGDFSGLLSDVALAAKLIAREVRSAGLGEILGASGTTNVSGDEVKKLDLFADATLINVLERGGHLCVMASEEREGPIAIPAEYPSGKYVVLFDPLDGSSNIDANVGVGTIFSIYERRSAGGPGLLDDLLQPGNRLRAAGYIIYGSSTVFVYSTGLGVHGFTLDPTVGEFILSHDPIRTRAKGAILSANEGNQFRWSDATRAYVSYLKEQDAATGRPYSSRYVGSLVVDFHRNLLYGGVFLYPEDEKNADGKLRLLYEAAPLAFIAEQAGGLASTGRARILDIEPRELHQRVPLVIGSAEDVALYERFQLGLRP